MKALDNQTKGIYSGNGTRVHLQQRICQHVKTICDGNCDKEYIDWNNKNWEDFVNFVEGL